MSKPFGATLRVAVAAVAAAFVVSCTGAQRPPDAAPSFKHATEQERLDDIARAKVWMATDVPSMDLRAGPQEKGAFEPFAKIECDYVQRDMGGTSRKFTCVLPGKDEVRIKYGERNVEVYSIVAASRLFWALGFGTDRWYPVIVTCHGCSADPWKNPKPVTTDTTFEAAALERKMPGKIIETHEDEGWQFTELQLVQPEEGGASDAERDALKLLAVFVQHSDSKHENQRLLCLDGEPGERCATPFMMVHDLGLTFGKATLANENSSTSINFQNWSGKPVWSNRQACIGNLPSSFTGTLNNPVIHEAGRKFLAGLLDQLSDRQLRDMFEVARFPQYSHIAVDEWVAVFKAKREQIDSVTCPS